MNSKKQFFLIACFIFTWSVFGVSYAESINWKSYDNGIAIAKHENKKIFLHFYADWCYYCKKMENETFKNNKIIEYLNKNFISIRLNADKEEKLVSKYGYRGLPFNWFLAYNGQPLGSFPGYSPPEKFIHYLMKAKSLRPDKS